MGIAEFVALMELEQLNTQQIGLAFRYKYIDTSKVFSIFLWSLLTLIITSVFYLINYEIKMIYFGLITSICIYLVSRFFKISRI